MNKIRCVKLCTLGSSLWVKVVDEEHQPQNQTMVRRDALLHRGDWWRFVGILNGGCTEHSKEVSHTLLFKGFQNGTHPFHPFICVARTRFVHDTVINESYTIMLMNLQCLWHTLWHFLRHLAQYATICSTFRACSSSIFQGFLNWSECRCGQGWILLFDCAETLRNIWSGSLSWWLPSMICFSFSLRIDA